MRKTDDRRVREALRQLRSIPEADRDSRQQAQLGLIRLLAANVHEQGVRLSSDEVSELFRHDFGLQLEDTAMAVVE